MTLSIVSDRKPISSLFALVLSCLAFSTSSDASSSIENAQEISVALSDNIAKDVERFLSGRHPSEISTYKGKHARRGVISLILLRQALHNAGLSGDISIRTEKVFLRNLNYTRDGMITMIGEPVWLEDVKHSKDKLFISSAMIREGEFVAGLFTHPGHPLISTSLNKNTLKNYSAVSNRTWKNDWALLEKLGPKNIQHSLFWSNIVKMVYAGRADFTLVPFQDTPELTISAYGVTLKAIPGVKVVFEGSRHFAVSRKHPLGASTYSALEAGLAKLRRDGTISRAYTEAGVFNERSQNWLQLNTPAPQGIPTTSNRQESGSPHTDHPLPLPQIWY